VAVLPQRIDQFCRTAWPRLDCLVYFTQEDPIGLAGGLNLYGYAAGDPVNNADPFGLSAEKKEDEQASADSTPQQPRESLLACVSRMASAEVEAFDETVAGWFGSGASAAGRAAQFGGGVLASRGAAAAGYATSSNASMLGRWLLNKSAVPPMRPLLVQGIRVGASSAGALTSTALVAGITTNAVAGAAVYYGFRAGVRAGSGLVALRHCAER
jgi:uncharacterized protein RhaS with RHS repeats